MTCRVVIAGASMAGLRMAENLRAAGFEGPITLVGDEPHPPYNRPPLSKEVLLGGAEPAQIMQTLAFRQRTPAGDTRWITGRAVAHADLAQHTLRLADGETLDYDVLVAATGLRPRRLSFDGGASRRFALRSFDDALALREALQPGRRLAVVGAGFIGCEAASSARKRGLDVTVIEPLALPMVRALGPRLAAAMRELHEREGVAFRLGTGVRALQAGSGTGPLRLVLDHGDDGDGEIVADLVLEAVGSHCNVEWLQGNGLDLADGLLCDGRLRVQGRDDLYAVGDIARFPNTFIDDVARRVEHWCVPTMTARRASESLVAALAGRPVGDAFHAMPSFWSDQHGLRLQSVGLPALGERTEVLEGNADAAGFRAGGAALGYYRGERLIGVASLGLPAARLGHYRELVSKAGPAAPAPAGSAP